MRARERIGVGIGVIVAAALLGSAHDAAACGACIGPPTENTQVSGHRMILSISKQQTTLYDQLAYVGSPSSFAWVLPIRGQVEVGLSSDLLFELLEQDTDVRLVAPNLNCPPPPSCPGDDRAAAGGVSDAAAAQDGGAVTVISHETVGPYETVQLASTDPHALNAWLDDHGYAVPPDLDPVIAAYLSEGFDFLALKLVPGQGVSAMRPVRVTTPGAAPSLPLRMVAGGAGAKVPIVLFTVGEGPWEPANFPTYRVDSSELVWDWSAGRSNYTSLVSAAFASNAGRTWLAESSIAYSAASLQSRIESAVAWQPSDYGPPSGHYGGSPPADDAGDGGAGDATTAADEDVATLFAGMSPTSVQLTRLRAELPRAALAKDLEMHVPSGWTQIPTYLQVSTSVNAPACPTYPPCGSESGIDPIAIAFGGSPDGSGGSSACSLDRGGAASGGAMVVAAALLALARRRRRTEGETLARGRAKGGES